MSVSFRSPYSLLLRRGLLTALVLLVSGCAQLLPSSGKPASTPTPPAVVRPARPPKPVVSDAQLRERARQMLQRATVASNEFSACAMFASSSHRGDGQSPQTTAAAATTSCSANLDEYESSMLAYYELNPVKPVSGASARDRARVDRNALESVTRNAVVQSLGNGR